jgi:hypothetical protein
VTAFAFAISIRAATHLVWLIEFIWTNRDTNKDPDFHQALFLSDWYAVGCPSIQKTSGTTSAHAKAHTRSTLAVCQGTVK